MSSIIGAAPTAALSLQERLAAAKTASRALATATTEQKNRALRAIADGVLAGSAEILAANELDLANGRENGLSTGLLDRLTRPDKSSKTARDNSATQSVGAANRMTATLIDLFVSQIRECWHPIVGAPNPADQIVRFDLRLNPNGTIASIETLTVSSSPRRA